MVNYIIKTFCSTTIMIMSISLSRETVEKAAENRRERYCYEGTGLYYCNLRWCNAI